MRKIDKNYINGQWVEAKAPQFMDVVNPATEEVAGQVVCSGSQDVDLAVAAAQEAFKSYSQAPVSERIELMETILSEYLKRQADLSAAMTEEMGAPKALAESLHYQAGYGHFSTALQTLKSYKFEEKRGISFIRKQPIGVCALITPWNWPMNQIATKAAPAIATGCTFVWKPSEYSPFSAQILTEIFDAAGVPAGVVNTVYGLGETVGAALSEHRGIDMASFTGSTRAGIAVATAAAPSVKRVSQELGGKSANIIMDDLDEAKFAEAIHAGVHTLAMNGGQNCNAPTRMLVPERKFDKAAGIAADAFSHLQPGDPTLPETPMGPVVNERQWNNIQKLIEQGLSEGLEVSTGGAGRPAGLNKGYYIKPTVFKCPDNNSTIARTEIFGPVLALIPYKDVDDAVEIANDSEYGLSGYVYAKDLETAASVGRRLRTGTVLLNGAFPDPQAPFGGFKQSGNGREWGEAAFEEYLELQAITEPTDAPPVGLPVS